MKILGFSHEHDSGVAFLNEGEMTYSANEERFNRKKFTRKLPSEALEAGKINFPNFFEKLDAVAVGSKIHVSQEVVDGTSLNILFKMLHWLRLDRFVFGTNFGASIMMAILRLFDIRRRAGIKKLLKASGIRAPIYYIDHHLSHASSAYFTSPWDKCLVVTLDAQGDGSCSKVYIGESRTIREVHHMPFFHTPGYYYWCVTLLLGFKQGREGKVTGLAVRGDYKKTLPIFEERVSFDKKHCKFINHGFYKREEYWYLKKRLAVFSREDIAAGIQKHLENLVTAYIKELIVRYNGWKPIPVALAGGVFANVTLNKKIMEMPEVSGIYIYPHMGDGGLAAGAAMVLAAKHGDIKPKPLENLYLGPEYRPALRAPLLVKEGMSIRSSPPHQRGGWGRLSIEAAQLLASGKTVAICRERMEYGPRALGNRSILHQATDPTVNDWLNKKLRREEFMPFAPILKKEYVGEYFKNWQKCEKALEFMTIALDATEKCKKEAPAIVHIDGTARPQIVTSEINPFIYELLGEYEKLTGKRIL